MRWASRPGTECRVRSSVWLVVGSGMGSGAGSPATPPWGFVLMMQRILISVILLVVPLVCVSAEETGLTGAARQQGDSRRAGDGRPGHPLRSHDIPGTMKDFASTAGYGWTEIPGSTFMNIAIPKAYWPLGKGEPAGPRAVIGAWTGAAYDGHRFMYFVGGGHAGYSGNEVYRLDLEDLRWEQLTWPNAVRWRNRKACGPEILEDDTAGNHVGPGPRSAHTYDGVTFFDGKLWYTGSAGFQSCRVGLWSFDVASTRWTRHKSPDETKRFVAYPTGGYHPGQGVWYLSKQSQFGYYDPENDSYTKTFPLSGWASTGNAVLSPDGTHFIRTTKKHIVHIPVAGSTVPFRKFRKPAAIHREAGFGFHDGWWWFWNNRREVVAGRFVGGPAAGGWEFKLFDHARGPTPGGSGKVFSKWLYLEKYGVFLAIPTNAGNLWIYRPEPLDRGVDLPEVSLQELVDRADDGDVVTLEKGARYFAGAVINKAVTIEGNGAHVSGVIRNKGVLLVTADGVVIRDVEISLRNYGDNNACIRLEGRDLLVDGLDCHDFQMGILTGGNVGRLEIRNSRFGNAGMNRHGNLGHMIYACSSGPTEEGTLVVRNSRFKNWRVRPGHGIKTRCANNVIENNEIDSGDTVGGRAVDVSCPSTTVLRGNRVRLGDKNENSDFIGLGWESNKGGCRMYQGRRPDLSLENNAFMCDRSGNEASGCVVVSGRNKSTLRLVGNTLICHEGIPASRCKWLGRKLSAAIDENNVLQTRAVRAAVDPGTPPSK